MSLFPILVFIFFALISYFSIELTQIDGRVAAFWPANAFLFAFLWRYSNRLTPSLLIAAFCGNVLADIAQGDALQMALFLSSINIFEVSIGFLLLKKFNVSLSAKKRLNDISRLLILVGGVACCSAAVLAATYFSLVFGKSFTLIWASWFLADALGIILITPMLLFFKLEEILEGLKPKNLIRTVYSWMLFLCVICVVFFQSQYPLFFVAIPAILMLTFINGFSSAVVGIFCIGLIAFISTLIDSSLLQIVSDNVASQVYFLQFFLAFSVLTTLPISARLADERTAYKVTVEAKKEAIAMRAEAETANRAKSEFLTSVSHELRTPLNAISGFGQLLEYGKKDLNKKQTEYVQSILEGSDHLIKMVDDILDLAKIENKKLVLAPEIVSIKATVNRAIRLMKPIAEKNYISIHCAGNYSGYYLGDSSRVLQVLINLISNAIKYNRKGGIVSISCDTSQNFVKVYVEDTGYGIDPMDYEALFEPFNRGNMQQGNVAGAGVGLSISKKLVEAMNGQIGIEPIPDSGSRFWFSLPLCQEELAPGPEDTESPLISDILQKKCGNKTVILYVEDNIWNARLLPDILAPINNLEVFVAECGQNGLNMAKELQPDLIILDIHLPDVTGYELAEEMRKVQGLEDIPIFALTADITKSAKEKGQLSKFDQWITKPFDIQNMQDLVRKTIMQT